MGFQSTADVWHYIEWPQPTAQKSKSRKAKTKPFLFQDLKNAEISDETNFNLETFPRDGKDEFSQKRPKIQVKLFDMRITF